MDGERGGDFIEANHKIPLHELDPNGKVTRIEDIALVCSNCHRIIHRGNTWITIDEMKLLVAH